MHIKRCNGCQIELDSKTDFRPRTRTVIEGRRVDGLAGSLGDGTLLSTDEEFHWCMTCTKIAFTAVADAAAARG